jgi:hypothetical protein
MRLHLAPAWLPETARQQRFNGAISVVHILAVLTGVRVQADAGAAQDGAEGGPQAGDGVQVGAGGLGLTLPPHIMGPIHITSPSPITGQALAATVRGHMRRPRRPSLRLSSSGSTSARCRRAYRAAAIE